VINTYGDASRYRCPYGCSSDPTDSGVSDDDNDDESETAVAVA
jgi:hypothetical protein